MMMGVLAQHCHYYNDSSYILHKNSFMWLVPLIQICCEMSIYMLVSVARVSNKTHLINSEKTPRYFTELSYL